jgi:hypothetical protein
VDNSTYLGNTLKGVVQKLAQKLPPGWQISHVSRLDGRGNAMLKLKAPSGKTGAVLLHSQRRLEPKDADLVEAPEKVAQKLPFLIVAPFISQRTQERLKRRGFGYADLAGNVYLSMSEPGLWLEMTGATQNPVRIPRERRSLRGAKAGRLIRALCDFRPPIGVRELAKRAGIDAGYASRLIDYLARQALILRQGRGPITTADWAGLINEWSKQYSPFDRARVSWYLSPRGISHTLEQLRKLPVRYAVSGSWAAAQFAPVSATRLLLCYADEVSTVAEALDIRPAEAGANVALTMPFDPVIYERTTHKSGIIMAALSQIAADLLRSPGRGPNEAETLMQWMREHEDAWRS